MMLRVVKMDWRNRGPNSPKSLGGGALSQRDVCKSIEEKTHDSISLTTIFAEV